MLYRGKFVQTLSNFHFSGRIREKDTHRNRLVVKLTKQDDDIFLRQYEFLEVFVSDAFKVGLAATDQGCSRKHGKKPHLHHVVSLSLVVPTVVALDVYTTCQQKVAVQSK